MKIVVTGGCGFIGSHLVRRLLEFGHEVSIIDNFSAEGTKLHNVDPNIVVGAEIHDLDIRSPDIFPIFEGADCCFHLAAEARIQASIEDPAHTASVNVFGTVNVLDACRAASVTKFVNSSSSSVYGLTDSFPTSEATPTDCLNPYAASKLAAEGMISCYTKVYDIEAFSLRYFNVFGEDSPVVGPYSLVVGRFLDQKSKGQALTVVGDGSSLRDFIYVGDVVDANIRCLTIHEPKHCILNVGSGQNISVLDIAKTISPGNYVFVDPRIGEAKQTLADISKISATLRWKPKTMILDWLAKQ